MRCASARLLHTDHPVPTRLFRGIQMPVRATQQLFQGSHPRRFDSHAYADSHPDSRADTVHRRTRNLQAQTLGALVSAPGIRVGSNHQEFLSPEAAYHILRAGR